MPPRLIKPLTGSNVFNGSSSPFICPSCLYRKKIADPQSRQKPQWHSTTRRRTWSRKASTVASVTAVDVPKEVPHTFRDLHESLGILQDKAANYVNLSQVKLALRGLESTDAVIRVAVLGLHGRRGVRRLVRALLADPLAAEAGWERQLSGPDDTDGRAVLIKYGEETDYNDKHPLLRTFSIPASTLHAHNLEILITNSSPNTGEVEAYDPASLLVPALETPISTNRYSMVNYPVHKAVVHGEELAGILGYARIGSGIAENEGLSDMIRGIIDVSWQPPAEVSGGDYGMTVVNLANAEKAVTVFRQSLDNSIDYEHRWFESGAAGASKWLLQGTRAEDSRVKPALRSLIELLLQRAETALQREEAESLAQSTSTAIPDTTRQTLDDIVKRWSEKAHVELRDQLDTAFHRKSWRRLGWWKLFWRVDDVSAIASDILQRSWLVTAEKEMIWIAGRVEQAGCIGLRPGRAVHVPPPEPAPSDTDDHLLGSFPPAPRLSDMLDQPIIDDDDIQPIDPSLPWPLLIHLARRHLALSTIFSLQALAQRLVLHTLSTTAVASALSALLYVSLSTTSAYEAGAIAALGFVWSMRRLQRKWEAARAFWEGE
ncbi:MAG: hypothetical protein LQ347_006215, partial [Umbilicaria vellea]